MATQLLQTPLSIKATGPMLDVLIHCKTEAQLIKKLKELKKLVNPPREKIVHRKKYLWKTVTHYEYISPIGKIEGKHTFEILHNHPEHPLTLKLKP